MDYMHAKFEVYSFNRSQDIEGSQNFKSRSCDPSWPPFLPNFAFFLLVPLVIYSVSQKKHPRHF